MTYRVQHESNGDWNVAFEGASQRCHGLAYAPSGRENAINSGLWLILHVPIWGGVPDREAIGSGIAAVEQYERPIEFGVRMFDDYKELFEWLPEATESLATPQWFLLRNGKLIGEYFGPLSTEAALQFIRSDGSVQNPGRY